MSKGKEQRRIAQERRLQAALRENLRRRKAQARGRLSGADDSAASREDRGDPPANERDKS